jgi:hypothetical protein
LQLLAGPWTTQKSHLLRWTWSRHYFPSSSENLPATIIQTEGSRSNVFHKIFLRHK